MELACNLLRAHVVPTRLKLRARNRRRRGHARAITALEVATLAPYPGLIQVDPGALRLLACRRFAGRLRDANGFVPALARVVSHI